jgi:hypothetical protein
MVADQLHTRGPDVISTVSLHRPRSGFISRLVTSCGGDLAGYRDGLIRDLEGLAADSLAAWLAVAVAVSQLADATTTVVALANSWPEQNPISAAVIARWGVGGLLAEKVVIATTVIFNMARLRGRSARWLGLLAVLVGLAAVVWNLHVTA